MARRVVRSFARGPRKATDWSASAALTVGVGLPAASAILTQVFVPIVGGETVIRTRGMLGWSSDNAAASENQLGAFGIGVVSEQAATVGITAVPHPGTDAAWGGWLYHTYWFSQTQFLSSVGLQFDKMHTIVIDSKAMRKVGETERLVVVWENTGASHGVSVFDSIRILSKVH